MFSVGDLARLGGVSIRTLRHYDEIGLLLPARVDKRTSYRFYGDSELARLRRIVMLRDLGFSLPETRAALEEHLTTEELRGMLRMRRAQLRDAIAADQARLDRLDALLITLERESTMTTSLPDGTITRADVAALTVVTSSAVASDFGASIGPVLQPLFPALFQQLAAAGVSPTGPAIAFYTDRPDGAIGVHAAVPIDPASAGALAGAASAQVVELPAIDAVSMRHLGSMATIGESYEVLMRWISEHGLSTDGYSREVYLDCPPDESAWVTELQFAVRPA